MNGIFMNVTGGDFTVKIYLICTAAALVCGILSALPDIIKKKASDSLCVTFVLLPAIVETVLLMVNGSVGTGIAVAGAFSLIRFRSAPARACDLLKIFLAMTAGVACAAGYIAIAFVFTLFVSVVLFIIGGRRGGVNECELRITVPESLNFIGAFDDLFDLYTESHELVSVRTSNMGSLYRLLYRIRMKDTGKVKELTDGLRCRNGNLEISICNAPERSDEL